MSRTPWIPMAVLFAIFLGTSIAVRAIQDSDPDLEPFERGLEQLSERLDEIELSVRSASKKFVMLEAQNTEVPSKVVEVSTWNGKPAGSNTVSWTQWKIRKKKTAADPNSK